MTIEEPVAPRALEPDWASYIDMLKRVSDSPRLIVAGGTDATPVREDPDISLEPMNWAEYVDRIYMQELIRRLDH
jgi:hypothetical protein